MDYLLRGFSCFHLTDLEASTLRLKFFSVYFLADRTEFRSVFSFSECISKSNSIYIINGTNIIYIILYMDKSTQQYLIMLEKKYLSKALEECLPCYDLSPTEDCTKSCGQQYIQFQTLKQFYLREKGSKITKAELKNVEKIVDSL